MAVPFVLTTLIWSTTWYVIRGQLVAVDPLWSVSFRFAIAGVAMAAYAAARGELRLDPKGYALAVAIGLAMFVGNYNLVYAAERYVTSGLVAVTFALLVVPNAVLGWAILKQPVSARFAWGSVVGLAGVAMLFAHELGRGGAGGQAVWRGIGLTLGAVLAASIGSILQASPAGRSRPIAGLLAWGMLAGAGVDAVLGWIASGPPPLVASASYWAGLLYLGLAASALAFTLYYELVRAIGPARAAYSSVLTPILAMGISTAWEGYRWTPTAAAGAVLAIAGLVVALSARSPSRKEG